MKIPLLKPRLPEQFNLSKPQATLLIFLCVISAALQLGSETYKLLTYYPAPYGSYKKFLTTSDTFLARDNGAALLVGTTNKPANLPVDAKIYSTGPLFVGDASDNDRFEGGLRWNKTAKQLQYNDGKGWQPIGAGDDDVMLRQVELTVNGSSAKLNTALTSKTQILSCSTGASYKVDVYNQSCQYNGWTATNCGGRSLLTTEYPGATCTATANGSTLNVSYSYRPFTTWKKGDCCGPVWHTGARGCNCIVTEVITSSGPLNVSATVTLKDYNAKTPKVLP